MYVENEGIAMETMNTQASDVDTFAKLLQSQKFCYLGSYECNEFALERECCNIRHFGSKLQLIRH